MIDNKIQEEIDALGFSKMASALSENHKQCQALLNDYSKKAEEGDLDPLKLQAPFTDLMTSLSQDPAKLMEANMQFMADSMKLYQQMSANYTNMLSGQKLDESNVSSESVVVPAPDDHRFQHEAWEQHPVFKHIKDNYLLASQWVQTLVANAEGLDEDTAKKVEFFTNRYLDALAPTNIAATNPAVLERLIETKGASLIHGMKNMLEDIEQGEGQLKIRMTDKSAFSLGENIATLEGKVVFQNRMYQLIQYSPRTEKVFKKPLLVVPPWINKFYILDLQPKNSFLRWLVDQGHTVFIMSWVNPDEQYRDTGFEEYIEDGVLTALNAIEQATGEQQVNAIGYCLGGTLLAATLAYMAANDDKRIDSATFLATLIDFSEPGDLGVFIDEESVVSLEKKMNKHGFLDGADMAGAFNMLRANDMIWSFYISNYLMGNDARPFDLLYWNSDSTRMPAKMHSWYLRNMYMKNLLKEPNGLEINGRSIDLGKVTTPVCLVSATEDHIAPWQSTYAGLLLFGGSKRFILGGSGHIAGIVNPPEANKYEYRMSTRPPADPEKWMVGAKAHDGSWWPAWQTWVKGKAGKQVDARVPGDRQLQPIEDAPGSYVLV